LDEPTNHVDIAGQERLEAQILPSRPPARLTTAISQLRSEPVFLRLDNAAS
jgi:hypothetical protein